MTDSDTSEIKKQIPVTNADLEPEDLSRDSIGLPSAYSLARTLDELNFGLILTNSNACVLYCNQRARDLAKSKAGLTVTIGSSLNAAAESDTVRLREFIRKAAFSANKLSEQSRHFAMALRDSSETDLQSIVIAGLRSDGLKGETSKACAVLFVTERNPDDRIPSSLLQGLFDLTSSEATLSTHLLEDEGLSLAARNSSMGINTARTHLKRIFAKTRVGRQAALVRLLLKTAGFVRFDR